MIASEETFRCALWRPRLLSTRIEYSIPGILLCGIFLEESWRGTGTRISNEILGRFGKRGESKIMSSRKKLRVNQSEVNCHYRGGGLLNDMSNCLSMTGITYIYVPNLSYMTCARNVPDS